MKNRFAKRMFASFVVLVMLFLSVTSIHNEAYANTKKKVTKVTITSPKSTLTMEVGETYTIKTKVTPSSASNKMTYNSSSKAVVKVSSKGILTAVKKGSATITVKAADGSGKKATFKVKVVEPVVTNNAASSVKFTTKNNFKSLMYIDIALPDGVTASDITSISFGVDAASALSMRLYAGDGVVSKDDKAELTNEESKLEIAETGKEDVTEAGKTVKKTKHTVTNDVVNTTRIVTTKGKQTVKFTVDSHAKSVLRTIEGDIVTLGIYAHNVKPSFSISSVKITTAKKTYEIELSSDNVDGLEGGSVSFK